MKTLCVLIVLMLPISSRRVPIRPRLPVFDFEFMDTSLQGEVNGPRSDEKDRLMRAGDQLRKAMAESGKYVVVDIGRSMLRRTAGTCRPAAAATYNTPRSLVRSRDHRCGSKSIEPHPQHEYLPAQCAYRAARNVDERRFSRQYRRDVVARMSFLLRNRLLAPNYGAPQ